MTQKSVMASGGYYVATHILMVWKRLAGLAPDQPHGWSFPDACRSILLLIEFQKSSDDLEYWVLMLREQYREKVRKAIARYLLVRRITIVHSFLTHPITG